MTRTALYSLALAAALVQAATAQDAAPAEPAPPAAPAPAADAPASADAPAAGDAPAAEPAPEPAPGAGTDAGTGFSTGEPVGTPLRVAEVQGDWEVRCVDTGNGSESCQMYQLLKEASGNNVAEITVVNLPAGGDAVAGATLATPLGTLLTAAVTFSVDGSKARRYPFNWCDEFGCYARIGFLAAEVDQLRRGNAARVEIVPVVAPDTKVDIAISLKGFTAAFDAVQRLNAAAPAPAPAAGGN
jgi:invasion protein IalB